MLKDRALKNFVVVVVVFFFFGPAGGGMGEYYENVCLLL